MLFGEFYKTSREPLTDASVIPRKNIDNLRGKGHQRKTATHKNFFSLSNTKIRQSLITLIQKKPVTKTSLNS